VTLVVPLVEGAAAPLARRNPLAKVLAAALLAMVLLVSLDPVTPGAPPRR
jgi:energy-coupling factor transport system permease protein